MLLALPGGGFLIAVNPEVPAPIPDEATRRRRLRFRLAHEIGHSFFYDRSHRPAQRALAPSRREEDFCQQFASALLVPPEPAATCPWDVGSLMAIRERFDISMHAAAWALVNSQPRLSIALLRWKEHPNREGEHAMRIVWGATNDHFLPQGASVPETWLERARLRGERGAEVHDFTLGSLRGHCRISVRPFGRERQALLFIEERKSSQTVPDSNASPRSEMPTQLPLI